MRSWKPLTGWAAAGAAWGLGVLSALSFMVGPVWAAGVTDLDLSLAPDGLGASVRLPAPGNTNGSLGGIVPYATLGGPVLAGEVPAPTGGDRYQSLAAPTAPRVDLGAGLSFRLFDRLQVFGEYRLFQVRSVGGSLTDGLKREGDGPALRAGFSVPF
jgi:hypothetical protein